MKVLMISTDRTIFAPESAAHRRMIEYGELVDQLHIIVFSKKELGYKDERISEHVHVYATQSGSKWRYVKDAVRVGKAIGKSEHVDLVTAQDPFESGLAGARIARALGVRLELQIHTDLFNPYFRKQSLLNRIRVRIAKRVLPKAECIRVVSPLIKESVLDHVPRVRAQKTCFTILPIYVAPFLEGASNEPTISFPGIEKQILFVGRFEKEKNLDLAFRAWSRIAGEHADTALVLVGDGSLRGHLEAFAKALGIAKQVIFVGFQKNVAPYFRAASIVLLTSNYEGAQRVLIEAAMEAKAIVSTDAGIARLLLDETEARFLAPVGDEQKVAEALDFLLSNAQVRHESGMRMESRLSRVAVLSKAAYLQTLASAWQRCVHLPLIRK